MRHLLINSIIAFSVLYVHTICNMLCMYLQFRKSFCFEICTEDTLFENSIFRSDTIFIQNKYLFKNKTTTFATVSILNSILDILLADFVSQ